MAKHQKQKQQKINQKFYGLKCDDIDKNFWGKKYAMKEKNPQKNYKICINTCCCLHVRVLAVWLWKC